MLTTDQKGAIAELKIASRAAELGIGVWSAYTIERYDLIFDLRPKLLRVQCKWAARYGDVIVVRCYRNRRNRDGLLKRLYSSDEIDAFAAYCAEVDECYLLPIDVFSGRVAIQLRLEPARNNQNLGINWAKEYEFAATLGAQGAIAQLGERRLGRAEATGSSPVSSTPRGANKTVGAHEFRDHFGWYMERASHGERFAITRRGKPFARLLPPTDQLELREPERAAA
jgi:prevent-host-death family protein